MAQNGGTVLFQADDWRPVFPKDSPSQWIAFVATRTVIRRLSGASLGAEEEEWLADWMCRYSPPAPDDTASYVYLGLAPRYSEMVPDGVVSERGVAGVGSGAGFGAPPGAHESSVGRIIEASVSQLREPRVDQ
jgi:hypothetical protein